MHSVKLTPSLLFYAERNKRFKIYLPNTQWEKLRFFV